MCSGDDRVWGEFFAWVAGGDDYLYESELGVTIASTLRPLAESAPVRMAT